MKILLKITGSISAYKACALASYWTQQGHSVTVALSESAQKFITKNTFEAITGNKVHTNTFEAGYLMDHISLIDKCDVVVTAPATANYINKVSQGIADDLCTQLALAHDFSKSYYIFPAMNHRMFQNPATQNSIKTLTDRGILIQQTDIGHLACGHEGPGRLLNVDNIVEIVKKKENKALLKGIITFGSTSEPIDAARVITNISSGKTGLNIYNHLKLCTDITAISSTYIGIKKNELFTTSESLYKSIISKVSSSHYDFIIHAAAVSDYTVDKIILNEKEISPNPELKLSSSEKLSLKLKKNIKIINSIKQNSMNKKIKLVGFKFLDSFNTEHKNEKILKLITQSNSDYIVFNAKDRISANEHCFEIYDKKMNLINSGISKLEMATQLKSLLLNQEKRK